MEYDYTGFKEDVYSLTKIDLNSYKEKQMKRRIDALIKNHGFRGYEEFVQQLKVNRPLFEEFVSYLTINVSEFYRNPELWKYLEEKVFPDLIDGHIYSSQALLSVHISISKFRTDCKCCRKAAQQRECMRRGFLCFPSVWRPEAPWRQP